jgi:16S rRNA A1518/A1519 N6-dimethyltransferase RsmA/KsgA/DIM1 with predicted DNA glycosylase/AP lyase activity
MYIMSWIFIIFLCAVMLSVAIFFIWNVYAIFFGAPFVPSSKKRIKTMRKIADLKDTDILLDVGSGDGRVLRSVASCVHEARGIEINPTLVLWSRMMNHICGSKNITIIQKDFWKENLGDVDVLFVYCIDSKMDRFEKKVKKEMKKESRIISNGFTMPTMQPTRQVDNVTLYVL